MRCRPTASASTNTLGPTPEEVAERKRQALAWGLATGAVRDIVQAYRRARHAEAEDLTSFNAACDVGLALGQPNDEVRNTVEVLLEWARANHREWFYRFEPPAAPAPDTLRPARTENRPNLDAKPLPPRHSPIF
jgi:hypothetical protein